MYDILLLYKQECRVKWMVQAILVLVCQIGEYIDLWLSKLNKNEDCRYINKETITTVIYARKIADIKEKS